MKAGDKSIEVGVELDLQNDLSTWSRGEREASRRLFLDKIYLSILANHRLTTQEMMLIGYFFPRKEFDEPYVGCDFIVWEKGTTEGHAKGL